MPSGEEAGRVRYSAWLGFWRRPRPDTGTTTTPRHGFALAYGAVEPVAQTICQCHRPTEIYGRPYSGHAIDQLENRGIPPVNGGWKVQRAGTR